MLKINKIKTEKGKELKRRRWGFPQTDLRRSQKLLLLLLLFL